MNAIVRMLVLIAATFVVMKVVVVAVTRIRLTPRQWLAYLGWFGMRPALFAQPPRSAGFPPAAPPASSRPAILAIAAGMALLLLARTLASPILAFVLALPALSLILHFGIIGLATSLYRRNGWPVNEPFRNPLASRSLSEFWSRRWNVGFSEMIAVTVHRPVRRHAGETAALFASFLASGLLHEIAISVPVGAGYGLPTLYFLLHGALVGAERRFPGVASRTWTIVWLVAPLPVLFHPPFLRGIVWPLVGL
ncbi:MAG TPA: MBOAT family protein [Thermoanaerobaculia bacterium]